MPTMRPTCNNSNKGVKIIMTDFLPGFLVYLKNSGLYLSGLHEDGLTPTQWNNSLKSAIVIPDLGKAYKIMSNVHRKINCILLSVDSRGTMRNVNLGNMQFKRFKTNIIFDTGGSIKSSSCAKTADEVITKMFSDLRNQVVSIEITPEQD